MGNYTDLQIKSHTATDSGYILNLSNSKKQITMIPANAKVGFYEGNTPVSFYSISIGLSDNSILSTEEVQRCIT